MATTVALNIKWNRQYWRGQSGDAGRVASYGSTGDSGLGAQAVAVEVEKQLSNTCLSC